MKPTDLIPLPTMPYDERPDALPLDIEECRTALWMVRGNIKAAADILKIPPKRLRKYVKDSPRLSAEVEEAREQLLDVAEDVVFEALNDTADTGRQDAMARFTLLNLGGSRGYGQKGSAGINLNLPKGKISISWEDGTSLTGEDNEKVIEHEAAE